MRVSPEVHAEIVRLRLTGLSRHRIAAITGRHWQVVKRVLIAEGLLEQAEKPRPESARPESNWKEAGDEATCEYGSPTRIRTMEDAIAYAEVDTEVWYVLDWECTAWEVGMKLRSFDDKGKVTGEAPITRNLWRIKIRLRRILPKPFLVASEALFARMKAFAPKYAPAPRHAAPGDPHMLSLDLFDAHFGKLAWAPETNSNYDLKIADRIFRNAVEDLVGKASGFPVAKIVFPIGNDFFHIDNQQGTTTAGTPMDRDGRYGKIIEVGEMAIIWAVEYMRTVAPVQVLWIPGNHDRIASYHLARTVAAWFRHCDDVVVDHAPAVRKYVHWGTNLLGFSHGNNERHASLPIIMATERPAEWAASTCREFKVGHLHTSKATETIPVSTHTGVTVRILRSLSGVDSWTFEKGYVGGTRAAEGYVYSKTDGYAGHFVANARE